MLILPQKHQRNGLMFPVENLDQIKEYLRENSIHVEIIE